MFYERFLILCEKEGVKPTTLLSNLGMSKGSLANWKDGKLPTGEILVRFSEHFGVSLDYLALGKISRSINTDEDQEWLRLIHKLPKDAQLEFKGELKGYLKAIDKLDETTEEFRKAK